MLTFDAKQFTKQLQSGYGVRYSVYHELGDETGVRILTKEAMKSQPAFKGFSYVCFAQFLSNMNEQRKKRSKIKDKTKRPPLANRLYYPVELHIPKETAMKWIEICRLTKLLPSYVKPEHLDTGFVIKFGTTKNARTSPSLIYVYLSALRNMEEHADLPRLAVHLIETHKMDPYAAIVLATRFAVGASAHHFVDWNSGGTAWMSSSQNTIESTKIPIRTLIALRRFVCNPQQYDNRRCCDGGVYEAFTRINAAAGKLPPYLVTACHLDDPNIINAIYAETDEEVKKHMAAFDASGKKKRPEKKV